MNIKLRFKNKATCQAIVLVTVAFIYEILGIFGIAVPITEDQVIQFAGLIITILVGLGILVDPTTAGIKDSARALTYDEPNAITVPDETFPVGGENAGNYEEAHEENDPEDAEV